MEQRLQEISKEKEILLQEKNVLLKEKERIKNNSTWESKNIEVIGCILEWVVKLLPLEILFLLIGMCFAGVRFLIGFLIIIITLVILYVKCEKEGKIKTENTNLYLDDKINEINGRLKELDAEYASIETKIKDEFRVIEKQVLEEKYQKVYKNKFMDITPEEICIEEIIDTSELDNEDHFLQDYLLSAEDELFLDNNERLDYLSDVIRVVHFCFQDFDAFLDTAYDIIRTPFRKYKMDQPFNGEPIFDKYIKNIYDYIVENYDYVEEWYNDLQKEYDIIKAGADGENYVKNAIKDLEMSSICHYNLRLEYNGENNEIDLLIISMYGIFVIEVKNYHRKKIKFTRDGNWIETKYDYEEEREVDEIIEKHPVAQNTRHEIYLEEIMNSNNFKNGVQFKVNGMIAIANNETEIINDSNYAIVRANNIVNEIRSHEVVFNREDLPVIEKIILNYKTNLGKYPIRNFMSNSEVTSFRDVLCYKYSIDNLKKNRLQYNKFIDEVVRDGRAIYERKTNRSI